MTWSARNILKTPLKQRALQLPPHLSLVIQTALKMLKIKKIWIFGSRARGDARDRSDFDLAFQTGVQQKKEWARFYSEIKENPPSLFQYDLVNYDEADDGLRRKIQNEGILLYEKRNSRTNHD